MIQDSLIGPAAAAPFGSRAFGRAKALEKEYRIEKAKGKSNNSIRVPTPWDILAPVFKLDFVHGKSDTEFLYMSGC
jgi:hypothetical protein